LTLGWIYALWVPHKRASPLQGQRRLPPNTQPEKDEDDMTKSTASLRASIMRLAPWHLDVAVTPELSTSISREGPNAVTADGEFPVSFISPGENWKALVRSIYPEGLGGRSVLDCACNCGGYSLWMRELGAGRCLGFDVRERWIEQALFLRDARNEPSHELDFASFGLDDLPHRGLGEFDISLFKGILYHLPDPIHGLQLVAERTKELMVVNTAARSDVQDGFLAMAPESVVHPMSGVHELAWYPTGPRVLTRALESLGFPANRCIFWNRQQLGQPPGIGRLEIWSARNEDVFAHFDALRASSGTSRTPGPGTAEPAPHVP
jgi:2-polyprenyl-3-methyl-5-hydroxy-6-metoxy-1,4-benzoquinol methylase